MITGTKSDFPLLRTYQENETPLAYLDNAATTQKPDSVIQAVHNYFTHSVANPHRGAYRLSNEATELYESARRKVAHFIKAPNENCIVFTKNSTSALNFIAQSYGEINVSKDDEIVISIAEHHSNLLPWQHLAHKKGAKLIYLYLDSEGRIPLKEMEEKIGPKTKIVAVTHISNVLGIENPLKTIAEITHHNDAVLVVDAAQSVAHQPLDVQESDIDFLVFSGHKIFAPDGAGVLYGKKSLLDNLEPQELGGGIVEEVTEQDVRYLDPPLCFEAGSPNVEAAVGLHAAIDYLETIGFDKIQETEKALTKYLLDQLADLSFITLYGQARGEDRHGVVAFNVENVHPHDVATILDAKGVAIRAGHHCAQPLLRYLGIRSCCRASLSFVNTFDDIDQLIDALHDVERWL